MQTTPLLGRRARRPLVVAWSVAALGLVLLAGRTRPMPQLDAEFRLPWPPHARVEIPDHLDGPFEFNTVNLTAALELCDDFDDDSVFPSDTCDVADAKAECRTLMPLHDLYYRACFDAACSGPSWGNPCAWQMIRDLPRVCAGRFQPRPPFGTSLDRPNRYPDLNADQREVLGLMEDFLGSCNIHSFCYTCRDDGEVNDFCAGVYLRYGGTPTATTFFEDVSDYWCDHLDELRSY